MSSPLEKSAVMEERYATLGEDCWGNRERQLYQKIFKKAAQLAYHHLEDTNDISIYDIGAGGGNVIDTWRENLPEGKCLSIKGCDISESAIKYLNDRYPGSKFDLIDLETYYNNKSTVFEEFHSFANNIKSSNIVSIVDVMYYFGEKRDYKETLDEIWDAITPGTIVVVADNLVRAFRRDYLGKKDNCETLESFTDYTEKICEEVSDSGKVWHRYLKVRIYRKV